jgi:hypothetical protein
MPHFFTRAERTALAKQGLARPDGSYPIRDARDLENARKDYVRTGRDPAVAAWISQRAKALNLPNPDRESYDDIVSRHASSAPK